MSNVTSPTQTIRDMVERNCLTYTWLIGRLAEDGIVTDKFQVSGALAGTIKGKKIDSIIEKSLAILSDYERRMGENT